MKEKAERELPIEKYTDPSFWRSLATPFSLTQEMPEGSLPPKLPLRDDARDEETLARAKAQLLEDGYLRLTSLFEEAAMARMAEGVLSIQKALGSPIWALMYDDLWHLLLSLDDLLKGWLGEGYQLLPDTWVWCLEQESHARGWRPHRDRERGSALPHQMPRILSLWLPLTHATPENGCIYVLPASQDPRYHRYGGVDEESSLDLQAIRALPAPAGSVLAWSAQLLHWGGCSSRWAQSPRISVAFELQAAGFSSKAPFTLPPQRPPFLLRLGLIARQLLQYQHMQPLPLPLTQACHRWMAAYLPKKRSFADVLANLFSTKKTPPHKTSD